MLKRHTLTEIQFNLTGYRLRAQYLFVHSVTIYSDGPRDGHIELWLSADEYEFVPEAVAPLFESLTEADGFRNPRVRKGTMSHLGYWECDFTVPTGMDFSTAAMQLAAKIAELIAISIWHWPDPIVTQKTLVYHNDEWIHFGRYLMICAGYDWRPASMPRPVIAPKPAAEA